MRDANSPTVAIVDYGMGNLFSVKHASTHAGLNARITSDVAELTGADGVILPGVGAFGDAMEALQHLDMVSPLREAAVSGKPIMGICLGMQLLMTESHEFGIHRGLGVIDGDVVRLENPRDGTRVLKVPHVGWNRVATARTSPCNGMGIWEDTPLRGIQDGEYMYFVHSYYVRPADPGVILSHTLYGHIDFCSSVRKLNIFACQFHPERSGLRGLQIYSDFAAQLKRQVTSAEG